MNFWPCVYVVPVVYGTYFLITGIKRYFKRRKKGNKMSPCDNCGSAAPDNEYTSLGEESYCQRCKPATVMVLIEKAERHVNSDMGGDVGDWMDHSAIADKIMTDLIFEINALIADSIHLTDMQAENKALKETIKELEHDIDEEYLGRM